MDSATALMQMGRWIENIGFIVIIRRDLKLGFSLVAENCFFVLIQ
jgi:hypothetical protein